MSFVHKCATQLTHNNLHNDRSHFQLWNYKHLHCPCPHETDQNGTGLIRSSAKTCKIFSAYWFSVIRWVRNIKQQLWSSFTHQWHHIIWRRSSLKGGFVCHFNSKVINYSIVDNNSQCLWCLRMSHVDVVDGLVTWWLNVAFAWVHKFIPDTVYTFV